MTKAGELLARRLSFGEMVYHAMNELHTQLSIIWVSVSGDGRDGQTVGHGVILDLISWACTQSTLPCG